MAQLGDIVARLMIRDLRALAREIEAYPDEESVWAVPPGVANSAGTLTLHVIGNLQHFIGAQLGRSGYRRDRDAEFTVRGTSRAELVRQAESTIAMIEAILPTLSAEQLAEPFPLEVAGVRVRTDDFVVHLAVHLGYHLGQVDYHRRLTAAPGTVGTMAIPELATARRMGEVP
jgi:uncharacterized damage-inducible protein DinB